MPIVNTLAVKVEVDARKARSGLNKFNQTLKRSGDRMKKFAANNRDLKSSLGNLVTAVGKTNPLLLATATAAVAAAAGIVKLTNSTAVYAESLQKMSLRTGVQVEALEELRFAAEQSGSGLGALLPTFRALARAAGEASEGVATYKDVFDELGVTVTDENGKLKDLDKLLEDVADGLKSTTSVTKQLALAQQILGRGAAELLPLLQGGSEATRELREERRALGRGITTEFANESAEYIDNLNRVKTSVRSVGITIAEDFLPSFNLFLDAMVGFNKDAAPKFQSSMRDVNFQVQRFQAGNLALSFALTGQIEQAKIYFALFRQSREDFGAYFDGAKDATEGTDELGVALDNAGKKADLFGEAMALALQAAGRDARTLAKIIQDTLAEPVTLKQRGTGETEDKPLGLPSRAETVELTEGLVSAFEIARGEAQLFFSEVVDLGSEAFGTIANFAADLGDALVDAATGATVSFKDMTISFLKDLAKMIARALILRLILSFLPGASIAGGFVNRLLSQGIPAPGQGFGDPSSMQLQPAGAGGTPSTSGDMEFRPTVIVNEPSPFTTIEFVDNRVVPRLESRRDDLNAETL